MLNLYEMKNADIEQKYDGKIQNFDSTRHIVWKNYKKIIVYKKNGKPFIDKWFNDIIRNVEIGEFYSKKEGRYILGILDDSTEIYSEDSGELITTLPIDVSHINNRTLYKSSNNLFGIDSYSHAIFDFNKKEYIYSFPDYISIRNLGEMQDGRLLGSGANTKMGNYDAAYDFKSQQIIFCKKPLSYPTFFDDGVIIFKTLSTDRFHMIIYRNDRFINIPLEYCLCLASRFSSDSYKGLGKYVFETNYGTVSYNVKSQKWDNGKALLLSLFEEGYGI